MSNNLKKCELCKDNATSLCFQCYMYLCDSCFKFIHDKPANNQHKKEKIDYFVPIDIKCPRHPKDRMNLYCVDDKRKYNIILYFKIYRIMLFNMLF